MTTVPNARSILVPAEKRYRIVSDGTPHGTEIFDPDGNRLDDVERIHFDDLIRLALNQQGRR